MVWLNWISKLQTSIEIYKEFFFRELKIRHLTFIFLVKVSDKHFISLVQSANLNIFMYKNLIFFMLRIINNFCFLFYGHC